jgi:hypothetical protein
MKGGKILFTSHPSGKIVLSFTETFAPKPLLLFSSISLISISTVCTSQAVLTFKSYLSRFKTRVICIQTLILGFLFYMMSPGI